jgi:hypothetical protein
MSPVAALCCCIKIKNGRSSDRNQPLTCEPLTESNRKPSPQDSPVRRTLGLPLFTTTALRELRDRELREAGPVFATRDGSQLDAANVRREFRAAVKAAGIPGTWSPRELRHTFVSLMSDSGVPVEEIARLAGHTTARTTEIVYRHQLRPVTEKAPSPWTSSSDALLEHRRARSCMLCLCSPRTLILGTRSRAAKTVLEFAEHRVLRARRSPHRGMAFPDPGWNARATGMHPARSLRGSGLLWCGRSGLARGDRCPGPPGVRGHVHVRGRADGDARAGDPGEAVADANEVDVCRDLPEVPALRDRVQVRPLLAVM